MTTFAGNPNELVRLVPHVGNVRHFRFNEEGKYSTENTRLIARISRKFEEVKEESHSCKKCDFTTDNKGLLMAHYRQDHPKEG